MKIELDTTTALKGELEGLRDMLDTILESSTEYEEDDSEDETEELDEDMTDEEFEELGKVDNEEQIVKPVRIVKPEVTKKEPTQEYDDDSDVI